MTFRDEAFSYTDRLGITKRYKYRCNSCGVRILYEKSMDKHDKKFHMTGTT